MNEKLNLKKHRIGNLGIEMMLCADIEIHKINGEYYVLDYARILPPTRPLNYWPSIFFRLFRSEFLKKLSVPVSSDSYSSFQSKDESNYNADIATAELITMIENTFKNEKEIESYISEEDIKYVLKPNIQFSEIQPKDYFTRKIQQNGINIRYFGKILLLLNKWKSNENILKRIQFLLTLMIVRV